VAIFAVIVVIMAAVIPVGFLGNLLMSMVGLMVAALATKSRSGERGDKFLKLVPSTFWARTCLPYF
jgi:hypothetical protein